MTDTLINPRNEVTIYDRSRRDLELFWLFSVMVANKPAHITDEKLSQMLSHRPSDELPFDYLKRLGERRRRALLEKHKIGQYTRIGRAITETFTHDIENDPREKLTEIYGVAYKTASFFVLHSRPGANIACLDTHVLAYLRDRGVDAPMTTPDEKPYRDLEKVCLECFAEDFPGMTPAEADYAVWLKAHNKIWRPDMAETTVTPAKPTRKVMNRLLKLQQNKQQLDQLYAAREKLQEELLDMVPEGQVLTFDDDFVATHVNNFDGKNVAYGHGPVRLREIVFRKKPQEKKTASSKK